MSYEALSNAKIARVDIEGCDPIFVREILLGDDTAIAKAESKMAAIISVSCVDESGKQIWNYKQACKIRKQMATPLLDVFYRINGLTEETIQDAEKN